LNAEPGCRRLRQAAHHRQDVAGRRVDGDERGLQVGDAVAPQPVRHGALRRVLQLRHERRVDPPVGWMVAAEPFAELLPQVFLGVSVPRLDGAGEPEHPRP
jgi:hypothetical protein